MSAAHHASRAVSEGSTTTTPSQCVADAWVVSSCRPADAPSTSGRRFTIPRNEIPVELLVASHNPRKVPSSALCSNAELRQAHRDASWAGKREYLLAGAAAGLHLAMFAWNLAFWGFEGMPPDRWVWRGPLLQPSCRSRGSVFATAASCLCVRCGCAAHTAVCCTSRAGEAVAFEHCGWLQHLPWCWGGPSSAGRLRASLLNTCVTVGDRGQTGGQNQFIAMCQPAAPEGRPQASLAAAVRISLCRAVRCRLTCHTMPCHSFHAAAGTGRTTPASSWACGQAGTATWREQRSCGTTTWSGLRAAGCRSPSGSRPLHAAGLC